VERLDRECADLLRVALIEEREILALQVGHRLAFLVLHDDLTSTRCVIARSGGTCCFAGAEI
jgi:hypothetical protein